MGHGWRDRVCERRDRGGDKVIQRSVSQDGQSGGKPHPPHSSSIKNWGEGGCGSNRRSQQHHGCVQPVYSGNDMHQDNRFPTSWGTALNNIHKQKHTGRTHRAMHCRNTADNKRKIIQQCWKTDASAEPTQVVSGCSTFAWAFFWYINTILVFFLTTFPQNEKAYFLNCFG